MGSRIKRKSPGWQAPPVREAATHAAKLFAETNKPDPGLGALGRDAESARAALQQFVNDVLDGRGRTVNDLVVAKLIRNALKVDMRDAANRKGDVPRALGLVSSIDPRTDRVHRAIYQFMARLVEATDEAGRFPTLIQAARVTAAAFESAGILPKGAEGADERILKIYRRFLAAGPAPTGPSPKR